MVSVCRSATIIPPVTACIYCCCAACIGKGKPCICVSGYGVEINRKEVVIDIAACAAHVHFYTGEVIVNEIIGNENITGIILRIRQVNTAITGRIINIIVANSILRNGQVLRGICGRIPYVQTAEANTLHDIALECICGSTAHAVQYHAVITGSYSRVIYHIALNGQTRMVG
ncbi:MAG: hypothetical protein IT283_01535 [Bacteroidetes bacterium]|nr:hypothetical protein [Bacteroidota bacterium]